MCLDGGVCGVTLYVSGWRGVWCDTVSRGGQMVVWCDSVCVERGGWMGVWCDTVCVSGVGVV